MILHLLVEPRVVRSIIEIELRKPTAHFLVHRCDAASTHFIDELARRIERDEPRVLRACQIDHRAVERERVAPARVPFGRLE